MLRSILINTLAWGVLVSGCSFKSEPDQLFSKTQSASNSFSDTVKIKNYDYIIKTSEDRVVRAKAAHKLVDLFFKANEYENVDKYLRYLVVHGVDKSSRLESQQKLADNLYYNLKKYKSAIDEYKKLLLLDRNWVTNQLMIVKSYFNLGEFSQVQIEIEKLLKLKIPKFVKFETLSAKANTFFASGNFTLASKEFKSLIESFPDLSAQNHIALNYSLSLEEEGLITEAVATLLELKETYHSPGFIDSKVEHLTQKLKKLPGGSHYAR